jgi:hypothetical protein
MSELQPLALPTGEVKNLIYQFAKVHPTEAIGVDEIERAIDNAMDCYLELMSFYMLNALENGRDTRNLLKSTQEIRAKHWEIHKLSAALEGREYIPSDEWFSTQVEPLAGEERSERYGQP